MSFQLLHNGRLAGSLTADMRLTTNDPILRKIFESWVDNGIKVMSPAGNTTEDFQGDNIDNVIPSSKTAGLVLLELSKLGYTVK